MSNRQEVISKAVKNLEQAVLAMPEDTGQNAPSQNQTSDAKSTDASTEPEQQPANAQTTPAPNPGEVVVGSDKPKKHSLLYKFHLRKHSTDKAIRKSNMVEA